MTENQENNLSQNFGKLLRTLKKRCTIGYRSQQNVRKDWPAALPFSMLNNIDTRPSRKKSIQERMTCDTSKRENREVKMNTISMVSFNRPLTCESRPRRLRFTEKRTTQAESATLFNAIKQQKLNRLQNEKDKLMSTMYNQTTPEIHRIDEDQDSIVKPNTLNFKAYQFLNKLMDLKQQIYHTTNYRPRTSGQLLRKNRRNKPQF